MILTAGLISFVITRRNTSAFANGSKGRVDVAGFAGDRGGFPVYIPHAPSVGGAQMPRACGYVFDGHGQ